MVQKKTKRPITTTQRAKSIAENSPSQEEAKSAAQMLGRLGGLVGGKARAKKLSAKRRSEIAKAAAAARWGHKGNTK